MALDPIQRVAGAELAGPSPATRQSRRVRVLREFSSALATCKEFAFSVADGDESDAHRDWFVASACQQANGWKWASAEPAVARWGNLQ
jgi:hypothetical protein